MAYKMTSPKGAKHPRESGFYMPYSPSAYVFTTIASVHGLWASVLNFQECQISSFRREMAVRIAKTFLGYDAKFASCSGKDWLLLGLICSVFLWTVIQGTLQRGIA